MSRKPDLHTRLEYALAWVRGRTELRPTVGVVTGSGLGGIADVLAGPVAIPYQEIPEFPVAGVAGHEGRILLGRVGETVVAFLQGRVHAYEGAAPEDLGFGVRLLARLGAGSILLTNAAGAVNPDLFPGDLVRITDHLNLSGANPLTGPGDERLGPRFPDLTEAYDRELAGVLDRCAARLGLPALRSGVYAYMAGPSYETPAEVRMLRTLGADLVGMSTVPEVIAARHVGARVAAIAVVANRAAGLAGRPLDHSDVLAVTASAREGLARLVACFASQAARPVPATR
jgi:purine-nucleoside phosphorylase